MLNFDACFCENNKNVRQYFRQDFLRDVLWRIPWSRYRLCRRWLSPRDWSCQRKISNAIWTGASRALPGHVTQRRESDTVEILSGVFEGKTTGTPIALLIRNEDQRSKDYS